MEFQAEVTEPTSSKRIGKRWDHAMVSITGTEIWQLLFTEVLLDQDPAIMVLNLVNYWTVMHQDNQAVIQDLLLVIVQEIQVVQIVAQVDQVALNQLRRTIGN
jgi:hypothetical protein